MESLKAESITLAVMVEFLNVGTFILLLFPVPNRGYKVCCLTVQFSCLSMCRSETFFCLFFFPAKFGVEPSGCVELAKHVKLNCPNLVFSGLMTIGMLDYSSTPENFKVT